MNAQSPALIIDGIIIPVTPHPEHEYTLSTAEVAAGYGVGEANIRELKRKHTEELIEGKHFSSVRNTDARNLQRVTTIWTKRGIIRLGFFIRSERAKRFRDLAEDLVLREWDQAPTPIVGYDNAALISVIRDLTVEVSLLREKIAGPPAQPDPAAPTALLSLLSTAQSVVRAKVIARTGVEGGGMLAQHLSSQRYWSSEFRKFSPPCSPRSLSRHLSQIEAHPIELPGGVSVVWKRDRTSHARCWDLTIA